MVTKTYVLGRYGDRVGDVRLPEEVNGKPVTSVILCLEEAAVTQISIKDTIPEFTYSILEVGDTPVKLTYYSVSEDG